MILHRYLLRESIQSAAAILLVLILVISANLLARALSLVAEGELPGSMVPALILFNALRMLTYLLPVALFLGLMFAMGRLARDSELAIFRACGFGVGRQTQAVLWIAVPVTLLTAVLTLWLVPVVEHQRDALFERAQHAHLADHVPVGRFIEATDGNVVAFIGRHASDGFERIFVFEHDAERGVFAVEGAPRARMLAEQEADYAALEEGRRIELAADGTVTRLEYDRHQILLPGQDHVPSDDRTLQSTQSLWQADHPRAQAELFERLSFALAAVVLALLAVVLAQAPPRSGRYGRLLWGILLYALYFNLITLTASWIGDGGMGLFTGLLLAHGVFVGVWLLLLFYASGGFRRWLITRKGEPQHAVD